MDFHSAGHGYTPNVFLSQVFWARPVRSAIHLDHEFFFIFDNFSDFCCIFFHLILVSIRLPHLLEVYFMFKPPLGTICNPEAHITSEEIFVMLPSTWVAWGIWSCLKHMKHHPTSRYFETKQLAYGKVVNPGTPDSIN